ncbi:hypothetical protein EDB86DRAFT_2826816 [Lactarius hatsudake]|nr:hypothetical protein EDB86DRAFT_2826816 [Lactarius hatsudake]
MYPGQTGSPEDHKRGYCSDGVVLGGRQGDKAVEFEAFTAMLHSCIVVCADGADLFRFHPKFGLDPCPEGLLVKGNELEEGRGGDEEMSYFYLQTLQVLELRKLAEQCHATITPSQVFCGNAGPGIHAINSTGILQMCMDITTRGNAEMNSIPSRTSWRAGGVSSAGSRDRLTRLEKTSGIAESAAYSRSNLGEDRSNGDVRRGMVEEGSVAVKLLGRPRGRQ